MSHPASFFAKKLFRSGNYLIFAQRVRFRGKQCCAWLQHLYWSRGRSPPHSSLLGQAVDIDTGHFYFKSKLFEKNYLELALCGPRSLVQGAYIGRGDML